MCLFIIKYILFSAYYSQGIVNFLLNSLGASEIEPCHHLFVLFIIIALRRQIVCSHTFIFPFLIMSLGWYVLFIFQDSAQILSPPGSSLNSEDWVRCPPFVLLPPPHLLHPLFTSVVALYVYCVYPYQIQSSLNTDNVLLLQHDSLF